ncbi:hypothetical protein [Rhizobium sp.]
MAIAEQSTVKSGEAPAVKAKNGGWLDLAMAMHLAAGRFSSPAGIVFMQHSYMPQLLKTRD